MNKSSSTVQEQKMDQNSTGSSIIKDSSKDPLKTIISIQFLNGDFRKVSRKDLLACSNHIQKLVKDYSKKFSSTDEKAPSVLEFLLYNFKKLYDNMEYIAYKKHLSGLGHHAGLASARRPIKCYLYCIEYFKGLIGHFKYLKDSNLSCAISRVMVNQSHSNFNIGARKRSRGRAVREDATKHRITLETTNYRLKKL